MTAYSVDLDSKAVEELEKKHGVKILKTPDDVLKAQVAAIDKVQKIRPPIEVVVAHYWKK